MATSAEVLSVSETMALLMRSMGRYVHRRLGTQEGKDSFRNAMRHCISCVESKLENLDMIKARIEGLRDEAPHLYPEKMLNKRLEERRCHKMAIDMCIDIVNSLEARFITGQGDDAPRNYRGKGYVYYEDQSLF